MHIELLFNDYQENQIQNATQIIAYTWECKAGIGLYLPMKLLLFNELRWTTYTRLCALLSSKSTRAMQPVQGITNIILVPLFYLKMLLNNLDELNQSLENFKGRVPRLLHAQDKLQLSCSGIEQNKQSSKCFNKAGMWVTKEQFKAFLREGNRPTGLKELFFTMSSRYLPLDSFVLGPCPNMCFACGRRGLSSGTLVIQMQTLTLTHDWWLVIAD